jgi:hypothetical protein
VLQGLPRDGELSVLRLELDDSERDLLVFRVFHECALEDFVLYGYVFVEPLLLRPNQSEYLRL